MMHFLHFFPSLKLLIMIIVFTNISIQALLISNLVHLLIELQTQAQEWFV